MYIRGPSLQVTEYLEAAFARRKSPNKLKVTMVIGAKPWLANTQHVLYQAGRKAVKRGMLPLLVSRGGLEHGGK